MRVTQDEADALAAACDEPKCWAGPGGFCKTPSGTPRRAHTGRVEAAGRLGLLGGVGLALLTEARQAAVDGQVITVGGTTLVLPPGKTAVVTVTDAG